MSCAAAAVASGGMLPPPGATLAVTAGRGTAAAVDADVERGEELQGRSSCDPVCDPCGERKLMVCGIAPTAGSATPGTGTSGDGWEANGCGAAVLGGAAAAGGRKGVVTARCHAACKAQKSAVAPSSGDWRSGQRTCEREGRAVKRTSGGDGGRAVH